METPKAITRTRMHCRDNAVEVCTRCEAAKPMHRVARWWKTPPIENLCCSCHVADGGAPADWHPDCLKAVEVSP